MDPSLVKSALDAVQKSDGDAALEVLKGLIASAAGAEADEADEGAGSADSAADGLPDATDPTVTESAAPPPPASKDDSADSSDDGSDDSEDPAKKAARKAMRVQLQRLTGASSMAEALATVETYRASHLTLETERQKLATERAALEADERRGLCAELVKLGAEFPGTIWADSSAKPMQLKARWTSMPIAELRQHVKEQRTARASKTPKAKVEIKPAPSATPALEAEGEGQEFNTPHGTVTLSAREMRFCNDAKADPKVYAANKAYQAAAKQGRA